MEKQKIKEKNSKLQKDILNEGLQTMITKYYNDLIVEDLKELEKTDKNSLAIRLRDTKIDKNLHMLMDSSISRTSHSISESIYQEESK